MEHNNRDKEQRKQIKLFREIRDCKHCLFFEESKRCAAMNMCLLDREQEPVAVKRYVSCPKDEIGNCPYGNDFGTCFGYCWKKVLEEFQEMRRKQNVFDKSSN